MRGLGVSFLLRRARASWLLLACVAVTVLLATGLAALLWTFAGAVVPFGAQGFLADPQDRVLAINGPVNAREAAADSQQIRAALRQAWPGVGFQLESALWTDQLQLPSPGNPTATRQIQLASLAGISAQVTLTAGTWPGPPHRGGPVPAAVPAAVASQLHLTVGSVLTATPQSGGAAVSLQVTGLFRANDPASPYWALDLLPVSGMSVQRYSVSYPRVQHLELVHQLRPRGGEPGRVRRGAHRTPGLVDGAAAGAGHGPGEPRGAQHRHQRGGDAAERTPARGADRDVGPAADPGRHRQHHRADPVAVHDRRAAVAAGGRGRPGAGRPAAGRPARGGVRAAAGAWRHQVAGGAAGAGRGGAGGRRGRPGGRAGRHPPDRQPGR